MFKKLFDFSCKRNALRAVVFYVLCFIAVYLINVILMLLMSGAGVTRPILIMVINVISAIFCLSISFIILLKKKSDTTGHICAAVLSGLLSLIGGPLLGLIPAAFLTTIDKKA